MSEMNIGHIGYSPDYQSEELNKLPEMIKAVEHFKREYDQLKPYITQLEVELEAIKKGYLSLQNENAQLAAHNRVLVEALRNASEILHDYTDDDGGEFYHELNKQCRDAFNQPSSLRAQRELAVLEAARKWAKIHRIPSDCLFQPESELGKLIQAVEALEGEG